MEHYSNIKMQKILPFVITQTNLGDIMLSEIQSNKYYITHTYVKPENVDLKIE